jgi:exodeoxyribonuclease VII small subunit
MATPELSYEEAREQLVEIVRRLEAGSVPLSESMALWERGEQLAAICQRWLDGARAKIEVARAPAAAGDGDAAGDTRPSRTPRSTGGKA